MFKQFKDFAMRGNVIDMAVGIVIGAAFGKVIASLVSDMLMPPIGMMLGGLSFSDQFINLGEGTYATLAAAQEAGAPVLAWGNFVDTIINFVIIAFALFMVIRQMNKLMPPPPAAPAKTHDCPKCLSAIPLKASRCPACTSEVQPA